MGMGRLKKRRRKRRTPYLVHGIIDLGNGTMR
jgi:hypothetical protein